MHSCIRLHLEKHTYTYIFTSKVNGRVKSIYIFKNIFIQKINIFITRNSNQFTILATFPY